MKQRLAVLEKIRQKLIDRKNQMTNHISMHSNEKVTDGQVQDSADEALSISMEKIQSSLQKTEIDELRQIDTALDRINKKEYGVCVDCGEPISEKRLESFPYASRCIVCQEEFEQ